MNVRAFSRSLDRSRARAEAVHLPGMERAYSKLIRAAGRDAALSLRAQTITAAIDWQPPPEGTLFDDQEQAAAASAALAREHRRVLAVVAGPPLERIGIAWDVAHPLSVELLANAAQRTGERLGEAVQPVLRATLLEAYEAGLAVKDAAALIRERIDDAAQWQAEMLARTDLNGLANGASVAAAKLAKVGTKTWLTAADERVREAHMNANGQTVPIDQPFAVCGEQLQFPSDPAGSDACTANCRCTVIYDTPRAATAAGGPRMDTLTAAVATAVRWQAVLAVEGEPTEDGRLLAPGSISWRDLPLTLMAMTETGPGGHEGAQLAGRIDEIWRDGSKIMGSGIFDSGDFGSEIARLVREQTLRGVSVDLAVREFEVRVVGEDGNVTDEEVGEIEAVLGDVDALFVVTDAVIGMATVCGFQAIGNASITIVGSGNETWRHIRDGQFSFPGPTVDERVAAALENLTTVTELAATTEHLERENETLRLQMQEVRVEADRRLEQATVAQKEELLAKIEAATQKVLAERKPRSVKVIRDDNGRAIGYEEGTAA